MRTTPTGTGRRAAELIKPHRPRRDLIDRFGWSVQALCGFLLMIAIYA